MLFLMHGIVFSDLLSDRHWNTCCRNQQEPGVDIITHGKETISLSSICSHPNIPRDYVNSPEQATDKVTSCKPGSPA